MVPLVIVEMLIMFLLALVRQYLNDVSSSRMATEARSAT